MAITTDITALRSHFINTVETANPDLVVIKDNQPNEQPPANGPWARFVIRPGSKSIVEGGSLKRFQQLGIAIFQIMVPPQMGDAVGYDLADACDVAFKNWRSADGAVTVESTEYRIVPPTERSPFFQINYQLNWRSKRG